ncbi:MAG: hypothetical protein PHC85_00890 [Candidatus Pacebacteria bacterium]|nr:hypothetical protein [Candidatus Paceibacterota bacterium]
MKKQTIIRTIYLYLFSLVGLTLMVIAGVRFINMGLKAFVFTGADDQQRVSSKILPVYAPVENLEKAAAGEQLTETERAEMQRIIADYKIWKEQSDKVDPVSSQRQRDASINLAMIIVGLPLYLYHWAVIRKEAKNIEV